MTVLSSRMYVRSLECLLNFYQHSYYLLFLEPSAHDLKSHRYIPVLLRTLVYKNDQLIFTTRRPIIGRALTGIMYTLIKLSKWFVVSTRNVKFLTDTSDGENAR